MDYTNIIIRPILSEKVSKLSEISKQYAFQVSTDSNKLLIKDFIDFKEKDCKVKVLFKFIDLKYLIFSFQDKFY